MEGGKVVRSAVTGVPAKGRDTMGVIFAKPDKNDRIIEVARNSERGLEGEESEDGADDDVTLAAEDGAAAVTATPATENDADPESESGAELNEDNTGGNE